MTQSEAIKAAIDAGYYIVKEKHFRDDYMFYKFRAFRPVPGKTVGESIGLYVVRPAACKAIVDAYLAEKAKS